MANGQYTQADINRMKAKIEILKEEMRQTPHRAELIQNEINNLEYQIREAQKGLK